MHKANYPSIGESLSIISDQLSSDEKVLWQGKPVLKPFIFSTNLYPIAVGLFFIIFVFGFFVLPLASSGAPLEFLLFSLPIMLIGIAFAFGPTLWSLLAYKNTEYLITDRRILIQTGAVGIDLRIIDLEKIQEVNVRIGFIDRLSNTGNIFAETAGHVFSSWQRAPGWGGTFVTRPSLASVKDPYEIQKLLQEAKRQLEETKSKNL